MRDAGRCIHRGGQCFTCCRNDDDSCVNNVHTHRFALRRSPLYVRLLRSRRYPRADSLLLGQLAERHENVRTVFEMYGAIELQVPASYAFHEDWDLEVILVRRRNGAVRGVDLGCVHLP